MLTIIINAFPVTGVDFNDSPMSPVLSCSLTLRNAHTCPFLDVNLSSTGVSLISFPSTIHAVLFVVSFYVVNYSQNTIL